MPFAQGQYLQYTGTKLKLQVGEAVLFLMDFYEGDRAVVRSLLDSSLWRFPESDLAPVKLVWLPNGAPVIITEDGNQKVRPVVPKVISMHPDNDTHAKGREAPFDYWEHDHTGLVHVLWSARHQGRTLHDADEVAHLILQSRWLAAREAQAVVKVLKSLADTAHDEENDTLSRWLLSHAEGLTKENLND